MPAFWHQFPYLDNHIVNLQLSNRYLIRLHIFFDTVPWFIILINLNFARTYPVKTSLRRALKIYIPFLTGLLETKHFHTLLAVICTNISTAVTSIAQRITVALFVFIFGTVQNSFQRSTFVFCALARFALAPTFAYFTVRIQWSGTRWRGRGRRSWSWCRETVRVLNNRYCGGAVFQSKFHGNNHL